MYAEQENELAVYKERNSNADGYIEALRARVTKLAEREASTEVSLVHCVTLLASPDDDHLCRAMSAISKRN